MIQQKFSLPLACPVLALIGLALGASNRKDGKLASFVLGFGVIFVYYVLLYRARASAIGGRAQPELAPWIPNIVLGARRASRCCSGARARRISRFGSALPGVLAARRDRAGVTGRSGRRHRPRRAAACVRGPRAPPQPAAGRACSTSTSSRQYLRVFVLAIRRRCSGSSTSRPSSIWPTSCSAAPRRPAMLLRYFYFQTPQFVYYVIPMAVLVATLVTDRRDDEEQRADRDARLRHQPVPHGGAAAAVRRRRQRRRCSRCRSRCSPTPTARPTG